MGRMVERANWIFSSSCTAPLRLPWPGGWTGLVVARWGGWLESLHNDVDLLPEFAGDPLRRLQHLLRSARTDFGTAAVREKLPGFLPRNVTPHHHLVTADIERDP